MKKYIIVENDQAFPLSVADEQWAIDHPDVYEVDNIPLSDFLYFEEGIVKVDVYLHKLRMKFLVDQACSLEKIKKDPVDNQMGSKLARLTRKEAKGTATEEEIAILGENDLLDDWYDAMDIQKDIEETWLEDPIRTDDEIINYRPEDIPWPIKET